jgi:hypothetical protein
LTNFSSYFLHIGDDLPDVNIYGTGDYATAATYTAESAELLRKVEQLVTKTLAEAGSLICSGIIAAGDTGESF